MIGLYISLGVALLLLAIWLFLIAARHDGRMDRYKGVYFAHRGLHGTLDIYPDAAPENSLAAFSRAVENGYGIELDVRLTADGELVVFHDDTLTRVTGVDKKVRELTLAELRGLSLLGTDERIPLFSEVLELVDGKVPLLVEIKEDGMDLTTARQAVKELWDYRGEYIMESFNPLSLGAVKKANPSVLRGFLCDKLTAQENTQLTIQVVSNMKAKLIDDDIIAIANENAKTVVEELLCATVHSIDPEFSVIVVQERRGKS